MHPTCIIDQRQKKKIENNKWNHIKFFILTWSVPRLHAHERPLTSALTIHPRPHPPPRLHLQVKYNNSENYKIVYLGMPLHFTIQYTPQYTAADHPLLCLTHTTPFLTSHHTHTTPHHAYTQLQHTTLHHYTTTHIPREILDWLLHTTWMKYLYILDSSSACRVSSVPRSLNVRCDNSMVKHFPSVTTVTHSLTWEQWRNSACL